MEQPKSRPRSGRKQPPPGWDSPLVARVVRYVEKRLRPSAAGKWKRTFRLWLAAQVYRAKKPGDPLTRDEWEFLKSDHLLLARQVRRPPPAGDSPRRLSNLGRPPRAAK